MADNQTGLVPPPTSASDEPTSESQPELTCKNVPSQTDPNIPASVSAMPSQLPNMFGHISERCVIFCIDTSGSMFLALDVVKKHLMDTLQSLARQNNDPMFNLIEFNSQVTQWSDKMVQCTPETVTVARDWVNKLEARTGTNTQEALLTALSDPDCQAVYLVTDDLPDQNTDQVLDNIVEISGNRRIHCSYIARETVDEAAVEFLEDLAVDTFGSLTIVTLNNYGSIERIKPVYCSDLAKEKLVWTVNNTLRPNIKTCSVSTSLHLNPDEILGLFPHSRLYDPVFTQSAAMFNTWPDRYYYPYYWSRYYPAKAWLRAQDRLVSSLGALSSPAGSLLVGKSVIARRLEDGYFYKATIQNQNLGKSFLVAFGPCKHGRYKQTEYQDVYVFDIVDYTEALRHSVRIGDRVLAPWEPEMERFGPGVVIEQQGDGSGAKDLIVAFSNGKTEKVCSNVAVWIPPAMYDRLSLELKMSASARKTLFATVENYPLENFPGYPTMDYPADFITVDPYALQPNPYIWDPAQFVNFPYLSSLYGYPPFLVKRRPMKEGYRNTPAVGVSDDDSALIPDTEMTKKELEARVMAQIMEHRCSRKDNSNLTSDSKVYDAKRETTDSKSLKLLERREKQEENQLNRHVHFECDEQSAVNKYFDDSAYDEYGNLTKSDRAVGTDSSLLFYSSPGVGHRPAWRKFWHNDPSPPYSEVTEGGVRRPTSAKSFKETILQAPIEARDQRTPPYNVDWASSAFKFVDTFARHDHTNSMKECLSAPHPPAKQLVDSRGQRFTVASQPVSNLPPEQREEVRLANRRRRVLKREAEWREKLKEEDHVKALMQDQHRERILGQMERERQREIQQQWDIHRVREAKKNISAEMRNRIEANQKEEALREGRRIAALAKRRERREQIQAQHEQEIQKCLERREQIRQQNNEARVNAHIERLDEAEVQAAKLEKQHRNAKLSRAHHFQKLEKEAQKKKELRSAVKVQHQAITRSYIFA